jgi:hypothetical protein
VLLVWLQGGISATWKSAVAINGMLGVKKRPVSNPVAINGMTFGIQSSLRTHALAAYSTN